MTDIWEAFVKRWAKQTQKSEAKIKPNKSLCIFFEDVVAAMRQEGMLNSQAKQQGSTEAPRKLTSEAAPQDKEPAQTTSEAKPKDTQVDKDLTSEAKPKEIVTTMTMKAAPRDNKTTKTTSEAKPKDKHVNKDLTLETEKKEKVSKATSEAAPEHKKDLREKIRAKATADLNKSEAKGRMHKLPSSLQQLNKIETMKTDVPKFNWADRSAHKARSNDLKVKLQFFMEAITFDANTPDKERGQPPSHPQLRRHHQGVTRLPQQTTILQRSQTSCLSSPEQLPGLPRPAGEWQHAGIQDKVYYYFINKDTKLTELATAIEPWTTYRDFNPEKPRMDDNTCTMKIWVHCKGVLDAKNKVKSRRTLQKDTQNRDWSRSSLKRPQERDRSPPRSKRPHRSHSRSQTRK